MSRKTSLLQAGKLKKKLAQNYSAPLQRKHRDKKCRVGRRSRLILRRATLQTTFVSPPVPAAGGGCGLRTRVALAGTYGYLYHQKEMLEDHMRMTARHFPVATIFSCLSSSAAKPTKWHIRHVTDNDVQLLSWPRRPRLRRRTMMPYSKTPPASRARRARDSGPRPLQPRHRLRALRSRPAPPAATPPH